MNYKGVAGGGCAEKSHWPRLAISLSVCVCVCVKGGGGDWLSTIEQLIVGPGERAILLGLPELQLQLQPPLRACQIASVCGHILQQFVWH